MKVPLFECSIRVDEKVRELVVQQWRSPLVFVLVKKLVSQHVEKSAPHSKNIYWRGFVELIVVENFWCHESVSS